MSKQFNYKFIASTDVSMIQRKLGGVKDDWDEFAELVDVFKISGRLNSPPLGAIRKMSKKFEYYFEMWKDPNDQAKHMREENIKSNMCGVSSFKEIYENN